MIGWRSRFQCGFSESPESLDRLTRCEPVALGWRRTWRLFLFQVNRFQVNCVPLAYIFGQAGVSTECHGHSGPAAATIGWGLP